MLQSPRCYDGDPPEKAICATSLEVIDQKGFDFAFIVASDMKSSVEALDKSFPELSRPSTSSGEDRTFKPALHLEPCRERPKSSDSVLSSLTVRKSQIGLALGSPYLPSAGSQLPHEHMSPDHHCHAFLLEGPLVCNTLKPKKWKLAKLFRAKSSEKDRATFYQVQVSGSHEDKKLGLPIQRNAWRNPKSPAINQGRCDGAGPVRSQQTKISHDASASRPAVPAIKVSIPGSDFERYSIMFAGIGHSQSNLLARRSRDLESLDLSVPAAKALSAPTHTRRATSPTISRHPHVEPKEKGTVAKYSLFPKAITASGSHGGSPCSTPGKSSMKIVQPSPTKTTFGSFSVTEKGPYLTPRPSSQLEPREFHQSAPSTPSTSSDGARHSAQSDIFFDVRSFRDSKGQPGQQYEMTRPPSEAMNMVKKQLGSKTHSQQTSIDTTTHDHAETRATKTASSEIDEVIAVVEKMTASSATSATEERQAGVEIRATNEPSLSTVSKPFEAEPESTDEIQLQVTKKPKRINLSKSGRELNIDVPSPVFESTEEISPGSSRPPIPILVPHQPVSRVARSGSLSHHASIKLRPNCTIKVPASDSQTVRSQMDANESLHNLTHNSAKVHTHSRAQSSSPIREQFPRQHSKTGSGNTIYHQKPTAIHASKNENTNSSSTSKASGIKTTTFQKPPRSSSLKPVKPYIRPNAPPPVPAKDSKYIPLSRFAPKHTTDTLVRQTGLRPVRPTRSNTEDCVNGAQSKTGPHPPTRSATMPDLHKRSPPTVAYVVPTAEVSVARTISLSRKVSARVVAGAEQKTPLAEQQKQQAKKSGAEEQVVEKKVALGVPVMQEVQSRHKPGLSVNVLIETSTTEPASPPPMPSPTALVEFACLLPPPGVPDVV